MAVSSPNRKKTLWEKEKLLVTSNFSFSHSVFKRPAQQTRKNLGLFGKGLSNLNNSFYQSSFRFFFSDTRLNMEVNWSFDLWQKLSTNQSRLRRQTGINALSLFLYRVQLILFLDWKSHHTNHLK